MILSWYCVCLFLEDSRVMEAAHPAWKNRESLRRPRAKQRARSKGAVEGEMERRLCIFPAVSSCAKHQGRGCNGRDAEATADVGAIHASARHLDHLWPRFATTLQRPANPPANVLRRPWTIAGSTVRQTTAIHYPSTLARSIIPINIPRSTL